MELMDVCENPTATDNIEEAIKKAFSEYSNELITIAKSQLPENLREIAKYVDPALEQSLNAAAARMFKTSDFKLFLNRAKELEDLKYESDQTEPVSYTKPGHINAPGYEAVLLEYYTKKLEKKFAKNNTELNSLMGQVEKKRQEVREVMEKFKKRS